MNKKNLQKMADHIRSVPQDQFDMLRCRTCVIGHCFSLDETVNIPLTAVNVHFLVPWAENYTGLSCDSSEWFWCFDCCWTLSDNTPNGAANRIEWLISKGLPKNFRRQAYGTDRLIYIP